MNTPQKDKIVKRKKFKINFKELDQLFFRGIKYFFLFVLSIIIMLGFEVYKKLEDPSAFQAWTFLIITVVGIIFIGWAVFTWKNTLPFGFLSYIILFVGVITNDFRLIRMSAMFFVLMIIYSFLHAFGLKVRIKFFWRGEQLK